MMRYAKAWVAALSAVLVVVTAAWADDVFDLTEMQQLVSVLVEQSLGVWAVYRVENKK